MNTSTATPVDNGVNVEVLLGAREALTGMPAAGQFQWQAGCEWVNGTHARTTVQNFFGLGETQAHNEAFVLDTDHPAIFAAEDNAVMPVEMVLAGLAGCLTAGVASVAQNRGIQHNSVTAVRQMDGGHVVETDQGTWTCQAVVIASGAAIMHRCRPANDSRRREGPAGDSDRPRQGLLIRRRRFLANQRRNHSRERCIKRAGSSIAV